MIVLLLVAGLAWPVLAQDGGDDDLQCEDSDIAAAIDDAIAQLEGAKALDSSAALDEIARVRADLNALDTSCRAIAVEGTHTNPIPLGTWYEVNTGKFRIVGVLDPYEPKSDSTRELPEGHRYVAIQMEYICDPPDPNDSCVGWDINVDSIVAADGSVQDGDTYFYEAPDFEETEAFGGSILEGNLYVELPIEVEIAQIRIGGEALDYDEVYVSLE